MEHVILVAFTVEATDRQTAESILHAGIGIRSLEERGFPEVNSWWVAEDDRHDGSDLDSAVFVAPGFQQRASRVLFAAGLTPDINLVDDTARSGQFVGEDPSRWPLDGDLR
jgi:hypothetical protein